MRKVSKSEGKQWRREGDEIAIKGILSNTLPELWKVRKFYYILKTKNNQFDSWVIKDCFLFGQKKGSFCSYPLTYH